MLEEYNKKRDFKKTKEPIGKLKKTKSSKLQFIIQHHIATTDHYDFRLEYNGVLVSFAVPKGPSFKTTDKRLAVKVEDHPLSYKDFEGNIPEGEYGAGTVMLFDTGTWEPYNKKKVDFINGPVKFTLNGKRFKGKWALVKFKSNNWLLIKEKDEFVSNKNIKSFKTSIKTGRTMQEIKENITPINNDIKLTSPKKVIFKKEKVTKEDIFNYYKLIGNRMMPFLDNRLISTVRCPNGNLNETFYMKHLNTDSKDIGKKKLKSKNNEESYYYYIKNINGLLSEVQMNSFEFHIWGSKQNSIKKPDILVFDLDPDEGLSLSSVRKCVKDLKVILDNLKLKSYLKTSGGKGYHIYVPIFDVTWKKCEEIAENISELMVLNNPNKYTTNIRKDKRDNKIFIDYFRNKEGATSVAPYSLRLKSNASISCPIKWSELDTVKPKDITIKNIRLRLKRKNPWEDFFN